MQATLPERRYALTSPVSRPWTTYILMIAVIIAMATEVVIYTQGLSLSAFLNTFGLVSADFSWTDPRSYLTLLTFNFLHSGARHFAGNAILMLLAGVAVEKYIGRRATMFVWVAGGVFAGLAHLVIFPDTARSLVGASGAIAALLGAATVIGWRWALPVRLWPGRRVLFRIHLPVLTGIWVAAQVYGALLLYNDAIASPSVATWVHLAGFAFGAATAAALIVYQSRQITPPARHTITSYGD